MASAGLSTRQNPGHLVVTLHGELDVTNAAEVAAALADAAASHRPVIVDLAAVEFIDCCGLGVLARAQAWARRAGGDLLLAAPGPRVRRLLVLTGMSGVFGVCASVQEAAGTARLPARCSTGPGAPLAAGR